MMADGNVGLILSPNLDPDNCNCSAAQYGCSCDKSRWCEHVIRVHQRGSGTRATAARQPSGVLQLWLKIMFMKMTAVGVSTLLKRDEVMCGLKRSFRDGQTIMLEHAPSTVCAQQAIG